MTTPPEDSRQDPDEDTLEQLQNRIWHDWAYNYEGYERFADADRLYSILLPAWEEFDATGQIPSWCGVDFLRAWAFYLARGLHWSTDGEYERPWRPVMYALATHPHASGNDIPPMLHGRY